MAKRHGFRIALGVGGSNEELSDQGIGMEHVEELLVRIAMKLFASGHGLSFGGTLGIYGKPLTKHVGRVRFIFRMGRCDVPSS